MSLIVLTAATTPERADYPDEMDDKGVSVTDIEVTRTEGVAKISFALHVGDRVTQENRSLIIDPVLQSSNGAVSLYPIVIRGSRAQAVNESQAMQAARISNEMPYHTTNGRTVEYVATIPWDDWMAGSDLVFNGISAGPGKSMEVAIGLVAGNLLNEQATVKEVISKPTPSPQALAQAQSQSSVPQQHVIQAPLPPVSQVQPETAMPAQNVVQAPLPPAPPTPTALGMPAVTDQGTVVQRPISPILANASANGTVGNSYGAAPTPAPYYKSAEVTGTLSAPSVGPAINYISVGDDLASRFMFVEPVQNYYTALQATNDAIFDYNMPLTLGTGVPQTQSEVDRFIEMTRKGSVFIRFNLGSQIAGRDFANNNRMMVDLISSIRLLESSPDVRVAQVVVAGFSSPEGSFAENEKLALDRAAVARDFLTANSNVDPKAISVYNGSIDWATLRALIANSNMPEKYTILSIIDNTPAWDGFRDTGRLERLMAVNDGQAYRYMREHFFPQLRQTGAYIKVYYENVR